MKAANVSLKFLHFILCVWGPVQFVSLRVKPSRWLVGSRLRSGLREAGVATSSWQESRRPKRPESGLRRHPEPGRHGRRPALLTTARAWFAGAAVLVEIPHVGELVVVPKSSKGGLVTPAALTEPSAYGLRVSSSTEERRVLQPQASPTGD